MSFGERMQLGVDPAKGSLNHSKIEDLIHRAGLRCRGADMRRVGLIEELALDREVVAQPAIRA